MPELVDGQIETVEPAVMVRMKDQVRAVDSEQPGEREPRSPLGYDATRFDRNVPLMSGLPPPAGRISKVPLSESPRTLPMVVVMTSASAVRLW